MSAMVQDLYRCLITPRDYPYPAYAQLAQLVEHRKYNILPPDPFRHQSGEEAGEWVGGMYDVAGSRVRVLRWAKYFWPTRYHI